jgi:hypothetical protein
MSVLRVKRLTVAIMLSISTTDATPVGQLGEQTSLFSLIRHEINLLGIGQFGTQLP